MTMSCQSMTINSKAKIKDKVQLVNFNNESFEHVEIE